MKHRDKHIDRIFQESFKEFEAKPDDQVWENIHLQLQTKKRRILPIWWKTAGVAAALAIAFGLGYFFQPQVVAPNSTYSYANNQKFIFENDTRWKQPFFNAASLLDELMETRISTTSNFAYQEGEELNPLSSENAEKQYVNEGLAKNSSSEIRISSEGFLLNEDGVDAEQQDNSFRFSSNYTPILPPTDLNLSSIADADSSSNNTNSLFENEKTDQKFDVFFEDEAVAEISSKTENWFFRPVISPIFNAGRNASAALGQEVANNSSNGDLSFSYGLQVGFKLTNKWSIRSGVNQVNTSYTTNDIVYAPGAIGFMPENVSSSYGLYAADFYSMNLSQEAGRLFSQQGSVSQQMNFLEIPIEMEYTLVEGKFGIHLTGGASTLLLTENSLMLNTTQGSQKIGEANNINQTSFSTNIGLGLNYKLTKKLNLNVEPALKYQINTVQQGDLNFNPYFFGVYSGLQFKF